MSKYNSKKCQYDGITFDSKRECNRYLYLKDQFDQFKITNLQLQKEFTLIPRQTDQNGKFKYHPIKYRCDFYYELPNGEKIVEDSKGFRTPEYKMKKKLMYYFHNIDIKEV